MVLTCAFPWQAGTGERKGQEPGAPRPGGLRGGRSAGGAALAAGECTKAEPEGEGAESPAARCDPAGTEIEKKNPHQEKNRLCAAERSFPPSTSLLRNQREEEINLPRPRVQGRRRRSREKAPDRFPQLLSL